MAVLFGDNLASPKNKTLQTAVKALRLLIFLIIILIIVKGAAVMPYSCKLVFSSLLGFWNSIRCLLSSSLYICIIINSMVVLIAISSSLHHQHYDDYNFDDHDINVADVHYHNVHGTKLPPAAPPPPFSLPRITTTTTTERFIRTTSTKMSSQPKKLYHDEEVGKVLFEKANLSLTTITLEPHEIKKPSNQLVNSLPPKFTEPIEEEMVVESNILGSSNRGKEILQQKEAETTQSPSKHDGNEDVAEEEDTLDATWKAITGGGRNDNELKTSETWSVPLPPRRSFAVERLDSEEVLPSTPQWKELRKSETFNDAVSITRRGGLRRDPSMSLDEFNKRVEAFIKNFNDNMRLQRQESDQKFLDMVNRGL